MNHSDKATALYTRVSTYDVNKKHLDNQMQQLFHYLQEEGKKEVDGITWEKVGLKVRGLYENVLRNYGK